MQNSRPILTDVAARVRPAPWRLWALIAAVSLAGAVAPAMEASAKRYDRQSYKGKAKPKPRAVIAKAVLDDPKSAAVNTPIIPLLTREQILASDRDRLERVGRHVMVGYHSYSAIRDLVEMRAIAGVFITDHNVRGRKPEAIKADIDALQEIRRSQALPPLVIAADQEGGSVSRLSPPLKWQPSLAMILVKAKDDAARQLAVEAFASQQAAELKRIGVTLNFSPVVDLNLDPKNRKDGETRLWQRAISADPYLVSKVAGWYCDALARAGLMCTLKHFPGLGRVKRDTHVTTGEISVSEGQLELNDWYPFRKLMDRPNAVTMLGHVRVSAIDGATPASYSETIIQSLIRKRWNYKGLLITDDFSMGAITRSGDGIGGAAVKALRAGADIVLVSYSEKYYDSVMSALLRADEEGVFAEHSRKASRERIGNTLERIPVELKP